MSKETEFSHFHNHKEYRNISTEIVQYPKTGMVDKIPTDAMPFVKMAISAHPRFLCLLSSHCEYIL